MGGVQTPDPLFDLQKCRILAQALTGVQLIIIFVLYV